jgi:translocation and assembly module TamA
MHLLYEQHKKDLIKLFQAIGYFDANFTTSQIRVNVDENYADIVIHAQTGERYQFGQVLYSQEEEDTFAVDYLNRFLTFKPGVPFHASKLTELQQNLAASNEFARIEIQPIKEQAKNHRIPIGVRLAARKPWRFSVGAGYGTDTGFRIRGGVDRRRLNRRAHQAGADALYSPIKWDFGLNYRIPLAKPATDYFLFRGSRTDEETDDIDSQKNAFTARMVHELGSWQRTAQISYERERYIVGDEAGLSRLLIPSLKYSRVAESRTPNRALRWRLDTELKGSHKNLASDTTFAQAIINAGLTKPFWEKYALVLRTDLGTTWVDDFSTLPASLRFFAGGDTSVRGYDYKSIGPEDTSGNIVGGEHLVTGSIELQRKVYKNWDIAVFFDIGDAFDNTEINLKKGAGVGVGWSIQMLTIRVYAGNALSDPDRPWRPHLVIGAQI